MNTPNGLGRVQIWRTRGSGSGRMVEARQGHSIIAGCSVGFEVWFKRSRLVNCRVAVLACAVCGCMMLVLCMTEQEVRLQSWPGLGLYGTDIQAYGEVVSSDVMLSVPHGRHSRKQAPK